LQKLFDIYNKHITRHLTYGWHLPKQIRFFFFKVTNKLDGYYCCHHLKKMNANDTLFNSHFFIG